MISSHSLAHYRNPSLIQYMTQSFLYQCMAVTASPLYPKRECKLLHCISAGRTGQLCTTFGYLVPQRYLNYRASSNHRPKNETMFVGRQFDKGILGRETTVHVKDAIIQSVSYSYSVITLLLIFFRYCQKIYRIY